MNTKLIHVTPEAEKHIAYTARVSSNNQDNPEIEKLIRYCIKHGHWSIFEMATMCVEIETSRAIAAQILRHKTFSFQEFSQRYAEAQDFEYSDARRQDKKNRQNSIDDIPEEDQEWFKVAQLEVSRLSESLYKEALSKGIAKECARFLLPLNTKTRLYMHGNIRSWITYFMVRCGPETQKEHRDIANAIKGIFCEQFPVIAKSLEWV